MFEYVTPGLISLVGVILALYLRSVDKRVETVKTGLGKRIDTVKTDLGKQIDDTNTRIEDTNTRIDDVRTESVKAHAAIGENIDRLRTEVREDIKEVRQDVGRLREDMTGLAGRVGRIEGILEEQEKN